MAQLSARHERVRIDQRLDHRVVGVGELALVVDDALRLLAAEQRHMLEIEAVLADGVRDFGMPASSKLFLCLT